MIATGGTIASRAGLEGLVPETNSAELLSYVPEILDFCEVETTQILNIHSTKITPEHWIKIAQTIK